MFRRIGPAVLYFTSLLLIGFAVFGSHGVVNLHSLNHEADSLHRKADSLSGEVERVQTELHDIEHNSSALEHRARRELGLSRGDEILYVQKTNAKKDPS